MRTKEYYYGFWLYKSAGIDPFISHVVEYLDGSRTVPVTKAPSISTENVLFTFSDSMLRMFLDNIEKLRKPYEVALKYGFRGYSRGGKNGIFLARNQDDGLLRGINSLIEKNKDQIVQDLNCSISDFPDLKHVKIVCHNPTGERVVGLMNQTNSRIFFLGFGRY